MINFGAAHQLAQANVRDPVKLKNPLQFFNYERPDTVDSAPDADEAPPRPRAQQLALFGIPAPPWASGGSRRTTPASGTGPGTTTPGAHPSTWQQPRRGRRPVGDLGDGQGVVTVADDAPGFVSLRAPSVQTGPATLPGMEDIPATAPAPRTRGKRTSARAPAQATLFDSEEAESLRVRFDGDDGRPHMMPPSAQFSHADAATPPPRGRSEHPPVDVLRPPPLQMQQHGDLMLSREAFQPARTVDLPRPFSVRTLPGYGTPARAVELPRRAAPQHAPTGPYQGLTQETYDTVNRHAPDVRTFPGFGKPARTV